MQWLAAGLLYTLKHAMPNCHLLRLSSKRLDQATANDKRLALVERTVGDKMGVSPHGNRP